MILILTGDKQGAQQVQVRTTALSFLPLALSVVEARLGSAQGFMLHYEPSACRFIKVLQILFTEESPESIKGLLKLLKSVSDMKDVTHLSVP